MIILKETIVVVVDLQTNLNVDPSWTETQLCFSLLGPQSSPDNWPGSEPPPPPPPWWMKK